MAHAQFRLGRVKLVNNNIVKLAMDKLPDLVLSRLLNYLSPEDTVRLARTCRRLYSLLPRYMVFYGPNFNIDGPRRGHWAPELYFDGPQFAGVVKKVQMSLTWKDQGWGNRKGEIFVKLMQPPARARRFGRRAKNSDRDGGGEIVAEKRELFGIAKHSQETAKAELVDDPVVKSAQKGNFYRFMRNAGGGGGHSLTVSDFRVVVTLDHN